MKKCTYCDGHGIVNKDGNSPKDGKGPWLNCPSCKATGYIVPPIAIGDTVHVDSQANQWPFERIVDDGKVVDITSRRFLVALQRGMENLWFPRNDCSKVNV